MSDEILVDVADHVCSVTLSRPEKRNALTVGMIGDLRAAVERAAADRTVHVVVLRAAGTVFCAGLDLRELASQREGGAADTQALESTLEVLEHCPQPTIAALQGDAVAGGCELALHCDLRVAADGARFAMPLARIGLAVPVGLTWKLVDAIGAAATLELLFTGEPIGAETALALGLVNRIVAGPDLDGAVAGLARQIAHNAPLAVRAMKAFVRRATEQRRTWRRDDLDELHRRIRASADLREGLAAQRERRPPLFRGE